MSKPRILMVITSSVVGGAETQVVSLVEHLTARGWEVAVVSLLASGPTATLANSVVPVLSLNMKRGIPDPCGVFRLARIVRDFQPDIVHAHMVHANLLARCTRLIERMPVLICTAHNTREASVKGGPTWYKELLYRLTDRLGDWTTIICQAGWDRYVATRAVPAARLQVIPIGIDCERFSPKPDRRTAARTELTIAANEFAWLTAVRLVVAKDLPNLLSAFALLKQDNWKLLIAGDGPLRQQLEASAQSLGIADRVRFLGVRRDMTNLFNAADAFVLSSAMEGLPVSALEAAACGLPCVVTDVGGTREAMLDGVNGYVVPARDSPALSQALSRLMSLSGNKLRGFAEASRAHCLHNFEIGSIVDRWEALYHRLLAENTQSHAAMVSSDTGSNKILYVITRSELGGAQIHLRDLLANLPTGWQPVLATGDRGYLYDEVSKLGIPVRLITHLTRAMSPLKDLLALHEIVQLIRSERPALLHVHTSKAGFLGRLAGALTHTPVVFTAHTWSFAEGISGFQKAVAIPMEWFGARVSGRIITVSQANERAARENSIGKSANVVTIWNGMPDTKRRAKPGSNAVFTLVMVARFAAQKDQKTLLMALAKINLPWRLWLAGDGPTKPEAVDLSHSLGIADRVHFLGDRADIGELLAASDLFVLATNWEGFPLAILEAMRAGLPVIATDVGGCGEAVTHGVTGFLTRPGDASQLAAFIENLISSPALVTSMGKAARTRFEQDFQLERMVEKTLAVYASAVPQMTFTASLSTLGTRLQEKNAEIPRGEPSTSGLAPAEAEVSTTHVELP